MRESHSTPETTHTRPYPIGSSRPLTEHEHAQILENLNRSASLPIKTQAKFQFHAAFDGTGNERGNTALSGNVDDTGVALIEKWLKQNESDRFSSHYVAGVGTGNIISRYIAATILPTGEAVDQAVKMYDFLVKKATTWAEKSNEDIDINITSMAFSRGCAAFLFFADLLDKHGIPDPRSAYVVEVPGPADGTWVEEIRYARQLVAPGVKLSAILVDPVETGVFGLPRLPDNVERLHVDYAIHEHRHHFRVMSFSNPKNPDPRVTTSHWAGAHSTLMGAYDINGVSAAYLSHARHVLMSMGTHVPEIPKKYSFIPETARVHDSAIGLQAGSWVPQRPTVAYWSKKYDADAVNSVDRTHTESSENTNEICSEPSSTKTSSGDVTVEIHLDFSLVQAEEHEAVKVDTPNSCLDLIAGPPNEAPGEQKTDARESGTQEATSQQPEAPTSSTEAPSDPEATEAPLEPATPDAAAIGRTAQSAMNAFNAFLSSIDNWGQLTDLQRVAALTNFYNGIGAISGGSIPLPTPMVTGASLLNIATALESGNHASALASTLQVVDTLTQTAQSAGIVSATLGNQFLPGLNLAMAVNSGNPISITNSALSLYAGNNPAAMAWIGPVGVFATIFSLAVAPQPPTVAGWSHADLNPQGELDTQITHDEEGGGQLSDAPLNQLLQAFKQNLDRIVDDEGRPQFALNPARVPEVGYWHDPTGMQYQRQGASMLLRWVDARGETITRFYDGAGNRADGSDENIAQDFARHAQAAIVPAWLLEGVMPRHRQLIQAATQLEGQVRTLQLEADAIAPRIDQRLHTDQGPLITPSPAPERHKALLPQIASLREQAALQRAQAQQLLLSLPTMQELGQKPTEHGDGTQSVEALTLTLEAEPESTIADSPEVQELRQVLTDLDGDGFLELTQWVRSNQALLGIDLNADGRLDGPELLSSDLRWLDANGDGRLDAQDPAFRAIRVWLDRNGDGQVQQPQRGKDGKPLLTAQNQPAESELKSLSQAGITTLHYGQGSVSATKVDGSVKPVEPTKVTGQTLGVRYQPAAPHTPGIIRMDEQPDGSGRPVFLPGNTGKPAAPRVAPPQATAAPHVNHNPVATDDVFAGLEDTPMEIAFEQLLINDWDEDTARAGDVLKVTGVSDAVHGVARMAPGHVIFEPAPDFFGQARFTYSISDGRGGSARATAFLNIHAVNDPPIIDSVTYNTAPNRWAWTHWDGDLYHYKDPTLASGQVLAHDKDTPGPLNYKIASAPVHGHASIDAASGAWQYRAELIDPYVGEDPFTVRVSDAEGAASLATVNTRHEKDRVREQDKQPIGWNPPKREPDPDWFAPVVVDLEGDGFQLLDAREQPVHLDVDGDGLPERLGWVGPEDALLALDRNGDGRITVPEEISFVGDWPGAATDLEGLRAFDSNGDGWLSADDARWQDFGLFRDLNSNGVQDEGEFTPIGQADVTAISLQREGAPEMVSGNLVWGSTQVLMADGSTRMAGDVMLRVMDGAGAEHSAGSEALLEQQIHQLVSAMASFAPPPAGQTTCAANDQWAMFPLCAVNGG